MLPTPQGSFRLFRLFGINVYLHWSWLLVVMFEVRMRAGAYSSISWNIFECLSLFAIILMHEFGHSLACRQVGGEADQIILWPLGGVAYVSPPQRAGAVLWSIVAGPLVNIALVPVLLAVALARSSGWISVSPDASQFIDNICYINAGLLIFNLLPIYPLDGGKILWALLWFIFGRARSLMIASALGFVGALALIPLVIRIGNVMTYAVLAFMLLNCWQGFSQAWAFLRRSRALKREDRACPVCKASPPAGPWWRCGKCRRSFDTFETNAVCPHCRTQYYTTMCVECGSHRPIDEWTSRPPPIPTNP